MKEEIIFKISRHDGGTEVEIPDPDEAVKALTDMTTVRIAQGDQSLLDILFAVIVHLCARDARGIMEDEFSDNLKKFVPEYRKAYFRTLTEVTGKMAN